MQAVHMLALGCRLSSLPEPILPQTLVLLMAIISLTNELMYWSLKDRDSPNFPTIASRSGPHLPSKPGPELNALARLAGQQGYEIHLSMRPQHLEL